MNSSLFLKISYLFILISILFIFVSIPFSSILANFSVFFKNFFLFDLKEPSKIIAVTFSNNFALNLSNLSNVQESFLDKIAGNLRHPEEVLKVRLERYLELNCLTLDELKQILNKSFSENEVSDFVDHGIYNDSIAKSLENILNINSSDLKFNKLNKEDEVL